MKKIEKSDSILRQQSKRIKDNQRQPTTTNDNQQQPTTTMVRRVTFKTEIAVARKGVPSNKRILRAGRKALKKSAAMPIIWAPKTRYNGVPYTERTFSSEELKKHERVNEICHLRDEIIRINKGNKEEGFPPQFQEGRMKKIEEHRRKIEKLECEMGVLKSNVDAPSSFFDDLGVEESEPESEFESEYESESEYEPEPEPTPKKIYTTEVSFGRKKTERRTQAVDGGVSVPASFFDYLGAEEPKPKPKPKKIYTTEVSFGKKKAVERERRPQVVDRGVSAPAWWYDDLDAEEPKSKPKKIYPTEVSFGKKKMERRERRKSRVENWLAEATQTFEESF